MGLDLMSFLDFGLGGGFVLDVIFLSSSVWVVGVSGLSGFFWFASCREWVWLWSVFRFIEGSAEKGSKASLSLGFSQLAVCLFLSVLSLGVFSFSPLAYSWGPQVWAMLSLGLPFWGGAVLLALSGMNWQGFVSKFTVGGSVWLGIGFLGLEMVTVLFRSVTLSVRISLNILVSLICAKLLFSLSVSMFWSSNIFWGLLDGGFVSSLMFCAVSLGYYVFEWFIGGLQSWLFTFLVVSYFDEGWVILEKVVTSTKKSA